MHHSFAVLALIALAAPGSAEGLWRWVPERCLELAQREQGFQTPERDPFRDAASATRRWNRHYRAGFTAVAEGDLDLAEREMCLALVAARGFDGDDWRYAETLDELGLVYYQLEDFDTAERMQGAAVAEILLVRGPTPPSEKPPSCKEPGFDLYLGRLGIVLSAEGRHELLEELESTPYHIFSLGYLPIDDGLIGRLDWLVSEYLRCEDVTAADELQALLARHSGQY